jgi:hypothetical protein
MPNWAAKNLQDHHQKRITQDKGCFEDLMAIQGREMTDAEYEQRSNDAVQHAWAEYECVSWDVVARAYRSPAAYFVDDQLVVAVTDLAKSDFITCFHEHFDGNRRHTFVMALPLGQRKLRYAQALQWRVQGRQILQLKRIRGV